MSALHRFPSARDGYCPEVEFSGYSTKRHQSRHLSKRTPTVDLAQFFSPSASPYTSTAHVQQSNMRRIPKWDQVRSAKGFQTSPTTLGPNRLTGPIQFVLKLLEDWHLSKEDAIGLLGFEQTDEAHVSDVLNGLDQFRGRDVRDRIAHLFHIRGTLSFLWQNLDVENDWLRESHSLLAEQSPLDLLLGGSMEDFLLVREYVDAAAGR